MKNVDPPKEVSKSNPFDALTSVENDEELGGGTSNLASQATNSSGSSFWNVDASSPSTTHVIEKIDKIEKLIIEGKVTLVDDDSKPLEKVYSSCDYDSKDEVASFDNYMPKFLAKNDGYGTQSLLEQWTESYENSDYEYDPYDDMYEVLSSCFPSLKEVVCPCNGQLTKVEFPRFDGEDVQGWLYRVNKFFEMDHIVDDEQRIRLVSMHVFGKALNWHKHFMSRFGEVVKWEVYQMQVKRRFESVFEDPNGGTEESQANHKCSEDIVYVVRMLRPTSLSDVFCLSKLQKASNSMSKSKHAPLLTASKNNVSGHNGQMYSLEVVACDEEVDNEDYEVDEQGMVGEEETMQQISLNAMTRVNNNQTMRIKGCEMVLGIQSLATLGTIQFYFKNLVIGFVVNGKRCGLRGTPQSTMQWMQGKQMTGVNTESKSNIQTLLKDFATVFDTPKELPPNTSHDHTIPLLPNTPPINIRPYKHPSKSEGCY
ncbi:hypothetical protein Tco_1284688 [Tanacetum coccineum]